MITIRRLAFLALLAVWMSVPSCAGKFPGDLWPALKACGSSDVTWQAATQVFGDLVEIADGNPAGETDLLNLLASDVGGGIPCLVNYFEKQGGPAGTAATRFKFLHVKEMERAADRGPRACREIYKKESPAGSALRAPAGRAFAYEGQTPGKALSVCEETCGGAALAPPDGCLCRRQIGGVARWIAAR